MKLILVDPVSGARFLEALAERVGTAKVSVSLSRGDDPFVLTPQDDVTHLGVVSALVNAVTDEERAPVAAIGHRGVHGATKFTESILIDDLVLSGISEVIPLAPLHARHLRAHHQ